MSMYSEDSYDDSSTAPTSSVASPTFLDNITLGDEAEFDGWVGTALGTGSQDFVQELLELGEESLEISAAEDELRNLQTRLNDAESRESKLKHELSTKCSRISQLEDMVAQLQNEVMEERARAKDEAEDMAQEMAEIRYQMTEMLEEERQIRAHTEKVSVQRVEELELQVKQAREELVAALTRRQESEYHAEKEIMKLRLELQHAQQQLEASSFQECKQCFELSEEIMQLKTKLSMMASDGEISGSVAEGNKRCEDEELPESQEARLIYDPTDEDAEERHELEFVKQEHEDELTAEGEQVSQEEGTTVVEEFPGDEIISRQEEQEESCKHCKAFVEEILQLKADLSCMKVTADESNLSTELPGSANPDETRSCGSEDLHDEIEECSSESATGSLGLEVTRLQQLIVQKSTELELAHVELTTCRGNLESQIELVEDLSRRIKDLEAELEAEKGSQSDSMSKLTGLTNSLEEMGQKLCTTEAELGLSKNKNEVLQRGIEAAEAKLAESVREKLVLHEDLQQLRSLLETQEQSLLRQQEELFSQRTANCQLARRIGELNSEVLILQQQLMTCQTQVSEMAMKNVILEDTVLAKKRKIKEGEEMISEQTGKLAKQEGVYFKLQAKFSALQNDFSALEAKLGETRKREQDARLQIERLSVELTMAKQEVVNSEVRLQRSLKQAKHKQIY